MTAPADGAVALVTGAGRGIGAAIARRLAADGFRVAVNSRTRERAEATSGELSPAAMAVPADVAAEEEVGRMVAAVVDRWGRVDVLVNNAGIDRRGGIDELEVEDWDAVFAVNVRGAFLCTRAVVPHMAAAGSGRIVNIGSWVGTRPYLESAPYCASKAALVQLTRAAALELASRAITVNAVCPGSTETEPADEAARARRVGGDPRELRSPIPAGRTARPEDVAHAVSFLASSAAGHVTGQTIFVDGGQSLV